MYKIVVYNHFYYFFLYFKDNDNLLIIGEIEVFCKFEVGEELSSLKGKDGRECCRLVPEYFRHIERSGISVILLT